MPSDGYFGVSVLIAGRRVPEFVHDGRVYVESNLCTPFSYAQVTEEFSNGEREVQSCPVTPYQLLVTLAPHCNKSVVFVYVDGVRVTKALLDKGQSRIISGFEDKSGLREFLFALPRFASDKSDRIDTKRKLRIGRIEVVRCEASYLKEEYRPTKDIDFDQANKKDALGVTNGKYTMSTTKKGKYICRVRPYDVQLKKLWKVGPESGRITLNYRMGHTLREMGIELKETDWTKILTVRHSSSHISVSSIGTSPESSPVSSPVSVDSRKDYIPDETLSEEEVEDVKPSIFKLQVAN